MHVFEHSVMLDIQINTFVDSNILHCIHNTFEKRIFHKLSNSIDKF